MTHRVGCISWVWSGGGGRVISPFMPPSNLKNWHTRRDATHLGLQPHHQPPPPAHPLFLPLLCLWQGHSPSVISLRSAPCACVCVCVKRRERERGNSRERGGKTETRATLHIHQWTVFAVPVPPDSAAAVASLLTGCRSWQWHVPPAGSPPPLRSLSGSNQRADAVWLELW